MQHSVIPLWAWRVVAVFGHGHTGRPYALARSSDWAGLSPYWARRLCLAWKRARASRAPARHAVQFPHKQNSVEGCSAQVSFPGNKQDAKTFHSAGQHSEGSKGSRMRESNETLPSILPSLCRVQATKYMSTLIVPYNINYFNLSLKLSVYIFEHRFLTKCHHVFGQLM